MKPYYYQMYPALYASGNYYFNNRWEKDLLTNKYATLEEALDMVKGTGIILREQNWYVYKVYFFGLLRFRISLASLYKDKLLSETIDVDDISVIYSWKT